ncbi:hypothetical protein HK098_004039 [Nowakowskiella sp. JEL0407]|nr:hypothetical protein HK098_004039 [Nowakowskiella sp. JEL0407]
MAIYLKFLKLFFFTFFSTVFLNLFLFFYPSLISSKYDSSNFISTKLQSTSNPAKFGTLLGITDGGVEVFSSDYDSIDDGPGPWEDPEWFSNFVNGTYTGFKWQCVELGRRYLLLNYGVVYDSIPMAYDIFRLKSVLRVSDNIRLKMHAIKNGEAELPQKGSLLIWSDIGEFKRTGHIAVIVNVGEDFVDIVEQNVDDTVWPKGQNYSRRLQAERKDGKITLKCTFPDTKILGWMNIDFNETYSYDGYPNCKPSQIKKEFVTLPASIANKPWLDESIPYLKVFTDSYGHELGSADKPSPYYTIPESFETALNFSTNELHKLFLDATDYVLHHEKDIGPHFRIPEKLWPKIRRSWFRHRHDIISGRFDYTITDKGLKVYEYNADSASCLLECGYIQSKWSEVAGVGNVGRSDADGLFKQLVETWTEKVVDGPLHLLCDNDKEEIYHSLYMKSAAEEAGIECHLLVGVESVKWTSCGSNLQDAEGRVIKNIWKTWSWRTALNQITDEEIQKYLTEHDENAKVTESSTNEGRKPPQLVDILLHDNIRIFEPLWTLLPSSKAILPVLWKLKPNHPYLLNSQFVLTPEFLKAGYVAKPVTGRAGANVSMFDAQGGLIEKTEGRWDQDQEVYQELAMLPKLDGEYVQFCTWAVGGAYAGTVLRIDKSGIINLQSSVSALRVISD